MRLKQAKLGLLNQVINPDEEGLYYNALIMFSSNKVIEGKRNLLKAKEQIFS